MFGKASQAVLAEATQGEIAEAPLEQLAELMLEHGNRRLLRCIPGIGLVYEADILAEVGEVQRFDNKGCENP